MRWRPQCGGCGAGHACQFVKLYIESRDKLRNMRTHNCPALQVITCDAVNNNWEKSAQSTAPPVYNLRIITKIEWLFVEINLHKTFLSDKVILWPWKRTRPRRLSRTQKAYFTYKHRVFTHTWSVLCDVLYQGRDSLVALFDYNCTPHRPKTQILWVWLICARNVTWGVTRRVTEIPCDRTLSSSHYSVSIVELKYFWVDTMQTHYKIPNVKITPATTGNEATTTTSTSVKIN